MLSISDDEGYFIASPGYIRSQVWPLSESSDIAIGSIKTLSAIDFIEVRKHPTHGEIGMVKTFTKHQYIQRPNPSKLKSYFYDTNIVSISDQYRLDQGSGIKDQGSGITGKKSVCSEVLSVPGGAEKAHLIYSAYPRKVGRPAALKAIIRALDKVPYDELLKSVEAYAAEQAGKDPQYIPHPTTWFNQERWADVPMTKPDEREIGFPVTKVSREKALWAEGEPDVIDLDSEYRKCVGEDSDEAGVDVDSDVGSSGGDVSGNPAEDVRDEEPADAVPS